MGSVSVGYTSFCYFQSIHVIEGSHRLVWLCLRRRIRQSALHLHLHYSSAWKRMASTKLSDSHCFVGMEQHKSHSARRKDQVSTSIVGSLPYYSYAPFTRSLVVMFVRRPRVRCHWTTATLSSTESLWYIFPHWLRIPSVAHEWGSSCIMVALLTSRS